MRDRLTIPVPRWTMIHQEITQEALLQQVAGTKGFEKGKG